MLDALAAIPPGQFGPAEAAHLLWRAGFGGTWKEAETLAAKGLEPAVAGLLERGDDAADATPPGFATLPLLTHDEFYKSLKDLPREKRQEARNARYARENEGIDALKYWWLKRMLDAPNPLVEKMTLFWHSHFASSFENKIRYTFPLWRQNQFFRTRALAPFPELMRGILRDPAMLVWLDNASSHRNRPNENLARELMELFSMGVNQYSEEDVRACARALTGYSVDRGTWQFVFREDAHDNDTKKFLGWTGNFGADDVVRIICEKEATAKFMARKLLEFFLYENPDPGLLDEATRVYAAYSLNTRAFLSTLFKSQIFYSREARGRIVKSPVVLALGAVKAMEVGLPPAEVLLDALRVMGQDLFFPPDVNGWPGGMTWINSNTLLVRYNFANFLLHGVSPSEFQVFDRDDAESATMRRRFVEGQRTEHAVDWNPREQLEKSGAIRDLTNPARITAHFVRQFLQRDATPETHATYLEFCTTDAAGGRAELTLRSDHFNERVKGLVHLIMSSPEYQLC